MVIERNEKIIESLIILLESNIGYQISIFGGLFSIYQLEDRRFSVNRTLYDVETDTTADEFEELFEDAREAVEFFERKRRELEIGFDIEGELNREAGLI